MRSANEDALICDLAETYGIYDYRALPISTVATLAVGLRGDSRIKMHLIGTKIPRRDLLLAAAVDRLGMLAWLNSEDGRKDTNRPVSILNVLMGADEKDNPVEAFDTAEAYEAAWAKITGVAHGR